MGTLDDEWENNIDYPFSFKKEAPIGNWYDQFSPYKQLWQWKTDVFNNQYALVKDTRNSTTIYNKKQTTGDLLIRNSRNVILPASAIYAEFTTTSNVYNVSAEIYTVKDFDIWYDTIMLRTPNYLIINKITYDFDTSLITLNIGDSDVIALNNAGYDDKFAGVWFFDDNKRVTLATLVSSTTAIYPQLRQYDIENEDMSFLYRNRCTDTDQLSSLSLSSIEDPVFTYNKNTDTYAMTFIGHSTIYTSFILINIFLKNLGNQYAVTKVSAITPLK